MWISMKTKTPLEAGCLEVKIQLIDGSEIVCVAQSDGDFLWDSCGATVFIQEHFVTNWQPLFGRVHV